MRRFYVLGAALMLSGCLTANDPTPPAPAAEAGINRDVARRLVLEQRSQIWTDPYSIREAKLGATMICPRAEFPAGASCACVEVNARNSMGGYAGLRRTVLVFEPGAPVSPIDAGIKGFPEICVSLEPFPELNGDFKTGGKRR